MSPFWPRVGPEHPVPGLFGGAEGLGRSGPRTLTGHGRTGSPWRHGELTSHRSVCAADVQRQGHDRHGGRPWRADGSVPVSAGPAGPSALLEAILNQSRVHKEHERFYSSSPLETALRLQRHARALLALADRWTTVEPATHRSMSPFAGTEDLNSEAAIALDGALFL